MDNKDLYFKKGPEDDLKWIETCRPSECNSIIKGCVWLIYSLVFRYL